MAASLTSRYRKHRSRKVFMFENAINKIDVLFFEDAEIKNSFQQVPSLTQLRDSTCSTAPPKHPTLRQGTAENDSQDTLDSRYHPFGNQPGSRNPLRVPPPPIALPTATPSPRISAGHPGVHRFGPSDTAAAAKSRSPNIRRVI